MNLISSVVGQMKHKKQETVQRIAPPPPKKSVFVTTGFIHDEKGYSYSDGKSITDDPDMPRTGCNVSAERDFEGTDIEPSRGNSNSVHAPGLTVLTH